MIFVIGCISYSEVTYKRKSLLYIYPQWAICVGWLLAAVSAIFIPIVLVYKILITPGTLLQVNPPPLVLETLLNTYTLFDSLILHTALVKVCPLYSLRSTTKVAGYIYPLYSIRNTIKVAGYIYPLCSL